MTAPLPPQEPYTDETIVVRPRPLPRRAVRRTPPPRRVTRRWMLVALAALGVLLLLLTGFYLQVRGVAQAIVVPDARPGRLVSPPLIGGINVLVLGVDERKDNPQEGVRSDSIIVAHLDAAGRWVNLLSIPRDTQVELPDYGTSKINAAYNLGYSAPERYGPQATPEQGGMALAADTVTTLFAQANPALRIDYTAQVNFEGFAQVIDALGGVTIDVPRYILDEEYPTEDFSTIRVEFQPGVQRMDGRTALIYARTRHADTDFDRSARQQQVLRAILAEIRGRNPLSRALLLPQLLNGVRGTVATTMPIDRVDILLGLLGLAGGLNPDEIGQVQLSFESDPAVQQLDSYMLRWSAAGLSQASARLNAPASSWAAPATVQVLNGTSRSGLASQVSAVLGGRGVTLVAAGDAPSNDLAQTVVYDVTGRAAAAKQVAQLLGGVPVRRGAPPGVTPQSDLVVVLGSDYRGP